MTKQIPLVERLTAYDPDPGKTAHEAAALITELVEALESAKLQLEYLDDKWTSTGTTAAELAKITAALAKARQQ
jgi:hypothetical protein